MRKFRRIIFSAVFSFIIAKILMFILTLSGTVTSSPKRRTFKIQPDQIWNSFQDDKIFHWNNGNERSKISNY